MLPSKTPKAASCGVIVTDGARVLLGHSTGNSHWDIPKGIAEPGEEPAAAAVRELFEETGIEAGVGELVPLGRLPYRPDKDLVLFALRRATLPGCDGLVCASMVEQPGRDPFPELDEFKLVPWAEIGRYATKRMAGCLASVRANACG